MEEISNFSKGYDLIGKGSKQRDKELRKKMSTLQDELALLETGDSFNFIKVFFFTILFL